MFPIAEDIHVLRSLKQRRMEHETTQNGVLFSATSPVPHICTRALTTLRAIKSLKEKTKECSLTLTTTSRHAHLILFAFSLLGYHAVAK